MKRILSAVILCTLVCLSISDTVSALDFDVASPPEHHYVDIDIPAEWYKDAKKFVVDEHILTSQKVGQYDDSLGQTYFQYDFFGERNITRGEVATVISRYDGNEDTLIPSIYKSSVCDVFADVSDGKWFTPAVQWASENGIVEGVGGKYFAPNRNITREEFATVMYRYTQYKNIDCDTAFDYGEEYTDSADVSSWAQEAMRWAIGIGLISGKPGGLIAPQDKITRAEVAVIVYRYNNTVLAHRDNME